MRLIDIVEKHSGELMRSAYEYFEADLYAHPEIALDEPRNWVLLAHVLNAADQDQVFRRAYRVADWYVNQEGSVMEKWQRCRSVWSALATAAQDEFSPDLPGVARIALKNLSRTELIRV